MAQEKIHHLAELAPIQAKKYGSDAALKVRTEDGKWNKISWSTLDDYVQRTAQSLIEFGVAPQDCVGVFSENKDKVFYADLAIYSIRGICVPVYATSAPEQLQFILSQTGIKILFVGDQMQYNIAYKMLKEENPLKQIVVFETSVRLHPEDKSSLYFSDFLKLGDTINAAAEVKVRRSKALRSDIATLIYTSGTTGLSKGVIITHNNIIVALEGHISRIPDMGHSHWSINFLPMSHIFEKLWSYLCLERGVRIAVCDKPKEILTYLKEVEPHFLCNVPRFWEKVYMGVQEKIETASPFIQKILRRGLEIGKEYNLKYKINGLTPPPLLAIKYTFFNKTGFRAVRKAIGLSHGKLFPTAGAALPIKINEFLQSMGIPIVVGYGLSETSATVCFYPQKRYILDSIGETLPGVSVRIDPDTGEILVKGGTITPGYYKNPEATEAAFTADGWFKTGDKGRMEGHTIFFEERLKDLFKTANGKYISPQQIEGLLSSDRYIEQITAIADDRPYVSALIYPNWAAVRTALDKRQIPNKDLSDAELANMEEVHTLIEGRVEQAQQGLASFERIKRFHILSQPFSIETGELTNTLKVKRRVVQEKYQKEINAIYNGQSANIK
ncbi:MAG: long-chain fatty acid--CoA ligase [Porphyromonas sp.]|nr:long-chain fatty acid--CoA ligase [Porphyromonas sp.]